MLKIIAMKTRIQLSSSDQTIFFHKRSKQYLSYLGETDAFQKNVINKALTCRQLHLQFFMLAVPMPSL